MSMFGPRPGSWSLSSESDPRWNCNGRSESMTVTAGMAQEARAKLAQLTATFGEPPDDLYYSCMKE